MVFIPNPRVTTARVGPELQVAAQDAKAKVIIDRFRAQYPYGIVNPSFPLKPPSPELKEMQQERNNIILRARDQLRAELGEEAFARFDQFVKQRALQGAQPAGPGVN